MSLQKRTGGRIADKAQVRWVGQVGSAAKAIRSKYELINYCFNLYAGGWSSRRFGWRTSSQRRVSRAEQVARFPAATGTCDDGGSQQRLLFRGVFGSPQDFDFPRT